MDKHELAAKLGITLPPPYEPAAETNGHSTHTGTAATSAAHEHVALDAYPEVRAALELDTGDRSADLMRVVAACFESGLTLGQARAAVHTRGDLVQKLAELGHDDVGRCWVKIVDSRQNLRWFDQTPPPPGSSDSDTSGGSSDAAATTGWEPVNLGPWLTGEINLPEPSLGIARTDGLRLLYPGHEHAVIGETESGKSWFALQCAAGELLAGNVVVYCHFEESNPASTIERLQLLGVPPDAIRDGLRFVAPSRPLANIEWLTALLTDPAPTLVVFDGVNEGMSLHGFDIFTADGAAKFRRVLVSPATRAGAAVVSCDHVPKSRDGQGRDAYGSVHKGNALDGARFILETVTPFGRGLRGASNVFVTKDRPGHLRARGRPTKIPGKTYLGTLVADASDPFSPFSLTLHPPRDGGQQAQEMGDLHDDMCAVIAAAGTVESSRKLYAAMRAAGHTAKEDVYKRVADDLVHAQRIEEVIGPRRSIGYRIKLSTAARTAAQGSDDD